MALEYERATKLTNANEALQIYQRIINTNEDSDYVWLPKLKKAEMFYATGSYITSSNILKEFNLNAPTHLLSQSSKDLLFKSLDAAGESDSLKVYQKLLSTNKVKKNAFKIIIIIVVIIIIYDICEKGRPLLFKGNPISRVIFSVNRSCTMTGLPTVRHRSRPYAKHIE